MEIAMKHVTYKVPKSKLLQLEFEITHNKIVHIQLTGDFFIYPETAIKEIEAFLTNRTIKEIGKKLIKFSYKKKYKNYWFYSSRPNKSNEKDILNKN